MVFSLFEVFDEGKNYARMQPGEIFHAVFFRRSPYRTNSVFGRESV